GPAARRRPGRGRQRRRGPADRETGGPASRQPRVAAVLGHPGGTRRSDRACPHRPPARARGTVPPLCGQGRARSPAGRPQPRRRRPRPGRVVSTPATAVSPRLECLSAYAPSHFAPARVQLTLTSNLTPPPTGSD